MYKLRNIGIEWSEIYQLFKAEILINENDLDDIKNIKKSSLHKVVARLATLCYYEMVH